MRESEISRRCMTEPFRDAHEIRRERAHAWFDRGLPLAASVDSELALDIELFTRGGQEILRASSVRRYDVLGRRPALSKSRKLLLLARAFARKVTAS